VRHRLLALGALLVTVAVVAAPASARLLHYPVNVSVSGSGTVSGQDSDGYTISCPPTCSALMRQDQDITLTESPAEGWTFVGWGGDCSGTGSTCTFNRADGSSVSVSATFDSSGPYELSVSRSGNGSGSVSGSGISCPSTCSATIDKGTSVTLAASAAKGSTFTGWSGACSGTGSCSFTMDGPKDVSATFSLPETPTYELTVSKAGTGTGTVSGDGIDCGSTCAASYTQGTSVTLTATAAADSTFVGWGGACSGTGSCTAKMDAAVSVTATFNLRPPPPKKVTLTVQKVGAGSGYVGGAGGIDCGPNCSADVVAGTTLALVASAETGSRFAGWSATACGTAPACTVKVDAPTILVARFEKALDITPPKVRAFRARARRGAVAKLRYRVDDAGGGVLQATGTILSGSTVLGQLKPRRVPDHTISSFSWKVPRLPPKSLKFCVRARDAAGNRSGTACAPIVVVP
jgi:uncharacterized repeat protein (TIGR02543 family)